MLADYFKKAAARAAVSAALLGSGALCVAAGIGFLTMALWAQLALLYGAPLASLILGAAYLGTGLIIIGVGLSKSNRTSTRTAAQGSAGSSFDAGDAPPLVQAFLYGVQAGIKARKP